MNTMPSFVRHTRPAPLALACCRAVLLCGLAASAWAQEPAAVAVAAAPATSATADNAPDNTPDDTAPEPVRIANGDQTRQWLQHQGSRQQASRNRQTLSGPAMTEVSQRYIRSFKTDIPATESLRSSLPNTRR